MAQCVRTTLDQIITNGQLLLKFLEFKTMGCNVDHMFLGSVLWIFQSDTVGVPACVMGDYEKLYK